MNDPVLQPVLDEFENEVTPQQLLVEVKSLQDQMTEIRDRGASAQILVPYTVRQEVSETLDELLRHLMKYDRASSKAAMAEELQTVIDAWDGEGALADDIDKVSLFAAYLITFFFITRVEKPQIRIANRSG